MVDEDYVCILPRSVKDWSDINDVLEERAQRLMTALASGLRENVPWEIEGPLFENGEQSITISRRLRADPAQQEDIHLVVSLGVEASDAPSPPDPLPINVYVAEQNQFVAPTTRAGELLSYLVTGAIMAGAAAIGFLVLRAIGSIILAILAWLVAMIALLIGAMALKSWIVGEPADPSTPSPEFVALVATVKGQLPPS